MSQQRKRTGNKGEELAEAFLVEEGYCVVARNYRCIYGEIDIVAWEGETLAFVEVKSRRTTDYGSPQLAVDRKKQNKISRVALHYLAEHGLRECRARFDVAAVILSPSQSRIELIRNAFELTCG